VRQRIISTFGCTADGVEFFRARLYPAIATNPYFLFHMRARDTGPIRFRWYDMTGHTYVAEARLTLG
jgi:sulfur-oxidizing protein SoxZ